MLTRTGAISLVIVAAAVSVSPAQTLPEFSKPQKEHEWLKQFVGEWETKAQGTAGPGQPAIECTGTMNCKMLGGYWMVNESKNSVSGMDIDALQTVGYDPDSKKYVGTWVDSMLNHIWKYEGSVDETGKILTLEAEGPNVVEGGKTAKFRDVYEFKSADHIVIKSEMLGDDGKWINFMTGEAHRKSGP